MVIYPPMGIRRYIKIILRNSFANQTTTDRHTPRLGMSILLVRYIYLSNIILIVKHNLNSSLCYFERMFLRDTNIFPCDFFLFFILFLLFSILHFIKRYILLLWFYFELKWNVANDFIINCSINFVRQLY